MQSFDHERLDVDRLSLDYVARSFEEVQPLERLHRHARDQSFRTDQLIPLNIAEGNGKRSLKGRDRFPDIARRSVLGCAAIQDVLVKTKGIKVQDDAEMKVMLQRIVAILTRMAMQFDSVAEPCAAYDAEIDCDNEHRCAENEHEISGRRNAWTMGCNGAAVVSFFARSLPSPADD